MTMKEVYIIWYLNKADFTYGVECVCSHENVAKRVVEMKSKMNPNIIYSYNHECPVNFYEKWQFYEDNNE